MRVNDFKKNALSALVLGALAVSLPAVGQQQPDAGQVLRDTQTGPTRSLEADVPPLTVPEPSHATPEDDGPTLEVSGFTVSGNTVFDDEQLLALLDDLAGLELSLGRLEQAAARLSAHYREHGYLLTRAYLPEQTVEDGQVEIAVLEGRLGEVQVNNLSRLRDGALERPLRRLHEGEPVQARPLESALLRLSDLPGADVRATLSPGESPGESNLVVDAAPEPLVSGSIDLDNYGNRYTGEYRLGGHVQLNSPLGLGDKLTLRGMASDESHLYFRGAYQAPVTPWGTQLGVAYSQMAYELGGDFEDLGATGDAQITSLFAIQDLVRSRTFNLNVQLQFDNKELSDEIELEGIESDKSSQLWTATLDGNLHDATGITAFSLAYSIGELDLDSEYDQLIDMLGPQTEGRFHVVRPSVMRLQRLGGNFSLHGQLNGQWASDNLDSSEKMSLGGAYGVRAFPQGEATGDEGWIANVELRYHLSRNWQVLGYADHGQIRFNSDRWTDDDNTRSLSGVGAGARWDSESWLFDASVATPVGSEEPQSGSDRDPRVWARASFRF